MKDLLKRVSEENDFHLIAIAMDEKSTMDKFQCLIEMTTNPIGVCQGMGDTEEEAEYNAVVACLDFIKIQVK